MEVRHDKGGKDISGGSYMGVSTGAACGSYDLALNKLKLAQIYIF